VWRFWIIMRNSKTSVGLSLIVTLFAQGVCSTANRCSQTITRDVVVIGGGASGAHAAVWLRDAGKSVVIVERADQLVSLHRLGSLAA
jgi:heterodisulfide reductase subunit A-like polyferredoxin